MTVQNNEGDIIKYIMVNRSLDYISEMWHSEALSGIVWEQTLDTGTGAIGVSDGYVYWDIDTTAAGNDDSYINSKYRFQCRPANFSDTNCTINKIFLEFELRTTGNLADITNAGFLLGFTETKANLNTQNNIAAFTLDGSDNLIARTDNDATDQDSSTITATLTNWNKFRIEAYATGYKFYLNQDLVATNETQVPDAAMYVIFATRSDGVGVVGLDIGNVFCYYVPNLG